MIDMICDKNDKVDLASKGADFKAEKLHAQELRDEKRAVELQARKEVDDNRDVMRLLLHATFDVPPPAPDAPPRPKRPKFDDLVSCLKGKGSKEEALALLAAEPLVCKVVDKWGKYPLHYACEFQSPAEVVEAIVKAFPRAAQRKAMDNRYPLYYAKQSAQVIVDQLIEAHPTLFDAMSLGERLTHRAPKEYVLPFITRQTSRVKDTQGNLMLHYACQYRSPDEVVRKLVQRNPESPQAPDSHGNLPLHVAVSFHASEAVVAEQEEIADVDLVEEVLVDDDVIDDADEDVVDDDDDSEDAPDVDDHEDDEDEDEDDHEDDEDDDDHEDDEDDEDDEGDEGEDDEDDDLPASDSDEASGVKPNAV